MVKLVFFSNLVDDDEDTEIQRDPELYQYPDAEKIRFKPDQTILIVLDTLKYPTVIWKNNAWTITYQNRFLCYIIKNTSHYSYIIEQGCCLREIIEKPFIQYGIGCVSDFMLKKSIC